MSQDQTSGMYRQVVKVAHFFKINPDKTQVSICRPHTAKAHFRYRVSPYGICGEKKIVLEQAVLQHFLILLFNIIKPMPILICVSHTLRNLSHTHTLQNPHTHTHKD